MVRQRYLFCGEPFKAGTSGSVVMMWRCIREVEEADVRCDAMFIVQEGADQNMHRGISPSVLASEHYWRTLDWQRKVEKKSARLV